MRFLLALIFILPVIDGIPPAALAAPSAKLQADLATHVYSFRLEKHKGDLRYAVWQVLSHASSAGVNPGDYWIAMEQVSNIPVTSVSGEIAEGRLQDQLDAVARSAGYVWQANGEWLNFIPKTKVDDPLYLMNQRMPGTIIVSRYFPTPVEKWFKTHRVYLPRGVELGRIRLDPPVYGPDPVTLHNPALREYFNARKSLFGEHQWKVTITIVPAKDGSSPPYTNLVF